jgi:hypothetical protein
MHEWPCLQDSQKQWQAQIIATGVTRVADQLYGGLSGPLATELWYSLPTPCWRLRRPEPVTDIWATVADSNRFRDEAEVRRTRLPSGLRMVVLSGVNGCEFVERRSC